MKSTGLFGKNSGRVGGVVYSNYRGQQIVRSYQPQVRNPNTLLQVSQRAKFKLVSQVGASLRKEIDLSFMPTVPKESGRNAFVRVMLKKTNFTNSKAALPIEDIVITNSTLEGFSSITVDGARISGQLSDNFTIAPKVRIVIVGYNENEEIIPILSNEPQLSFSSGVYSINYNLASLITTIPNTFSNYRALVFVYDIDDAQGVSYSDYVALSDNATLSDVVRYYSGKLLFSETRNLPINLAGTATS